MKTTRAINENENENENERNKTQTDLQRKLVRAGDARTSAAVAIAPSLPDILLKKCKVSSTVVVDPDPLDIRCCATSSHARADNPLSQNLKWEKEKNKKSGGRDHRWVRRTKHSC